MQFDIAMLYVPKATPEQATADKGPQQQAANDDKAAKPDTAKKDGVKVAAPATGKTDGDKALKSASDKSDKKKKDRGTQTDSAANAKAAAGGKGGAR